MKLNDEPVDWSKQQLEYLLKDNYDVTFMKQVAAARLATLNEIRDPHGVRCFSKDGPDMWKTGREAQGCGCEHGLRFCREMAAQAGRGTDHRVTGRP